MPRKYFIASGYYTSKELRKLKTEQRLIQQSMSGSDDAARASKVKITEMRITPELPERKRTREPEDIMANLDDLKSNSDRLVIGTVIRARDSVARMVIDAPIAKYGRGSWLWLRLANGDLMLACYPRGLTYEKCSADKKLP